jgi:hypothetical protein
MTRTSVFALLFLVATACADHPRSSTGDDHTAAAEAFTRHYARSRLGKWNIRAHAAGADCDVLFVETPMLLEDSLIEALHYGTGAYAVYEGHGVQHFCLERAFRGAAYKDRSGHIWTFGKVTTSEAETLRICRRQ